MEFIHSFTEDHGVKAAHQCALINCSEAPSLGDISNTSSTAGDACRNEVTFNNTSSSVTWMHLVRVLKDHPVHILMLSVCKRGPG